MSSFRESAVFYAWVGEDGEPVTPLYDGQSPATKYLVDRLLREVYSQEGYPKAPQYRDFTGPKGYHEWNVAYKAWDKKLRAEAKSLIKEPRFKLVTYRLVRDV